MMVTATLSAMYQSFIIASQFASGEKSSR